MDNKHKMMMMMLMLCKIQLNFQKRRKKIHTIPYYTILKLRRKQKPAGRRLKRILVKNKMINN